jgi:hypothetical protein
MADTDPLATELAAMQEREQAATPGPWWFGEDDLMWRLHGVHATIPAQCFPGSDEVMFPEQVINHQILKAPKKGTTYAEYWPGEADAAFIVAARSDVPRLVAAVVAILAQHQPGRIVLLGALCSRHEAHRLFSITAEEAADVRDCPDCAAAVFASCTGCGAGMRLDSCPARMAITRELTGEDGQ